MRGRARWPAKGSNALGALSRCHQTQLSRTNYIMSGFLIAVLSVGVILGFMILIHEFRHYATAKLLGVRVEVVSIGFGKRLFGSRPGDTDYRTAPTPLRGYLKLSAQT